MKDHDIVPWSAFLIFDDFFNLLERKWTAEALTSRWNLQWLQMLLTWTIVISKAWDNWSRTNVHSLLVGSSFSVLEKPHKKVQQLCYCHLNSEGQNHRAQFETITCGYSCCNLPS